MPRHTYMVLCALWTSDDEEYRVKVMYHTAFFQERYPLVVHNLLHLFNWSVVLSTNKMVLSAGTKIFILASLANRSFVADICIICSYLRPSTCLLLHSDSRQIGTWHSVQIHVVRRVPNFRWCEGKGREELFEISPRGVLPAGLPRGL
jgi:hypothetical protein